ncbi:MAG: sulfatase-like hydrolase/transferase, partial [Planctomycetota bacterium]
MALLLAFDTTAATKSQPAAETPAPEIAESDGDESVEPDVAADDEPESEPLDPPNVVFILVDDLGWAELGCYGNKFNETPNIDRLAKGGMRFTQAYAAGPIGTATRVALMTGQSPARAGLTNYLRPTSNWQIPAEILTLPELFQSAGYDTGMVGKWHLSGYRRNRVVSGPAKHGFAHVAVSEQVGIGAGSYFHPYTRVDPKLPARPTSSTGESPKNGAEYLVDRVNAEAVDFLQKPREQPFFLYISHYAVRTSLLGKPDLVDQFGQKPEAGDGQYASRNNPHLAAMLKTVD